MVNFYEDLCLATHSSLDLSMINSVIPKPGSLEDNDHLTAIRKSCSLDKNGSLGPNGFGGIFFTTCWSIIKTDIINVI